MIKMSELADMNFKTSIIDMVQKIKGKYGYNGWTDREFQLRNRNYI